METPRGADAAGIEAGEIVLPCPALDDTLRFFVERLGFELDSIRPADDPTSALVIGHGLRVRLERDLGGSPGVLRLLCRDPSALAGDERELRAPNGTRILIAESHPPIVLPALRPSLVIAKLDEKTRWIEGRAGMRYRDLLPGRLGGRFIASHIQLTSGGPVPDYVHFHRVRFQMIYCTKGWVRAVYEDQGEPFLLEAGDAVLQPPEIRHRVLEASAIAEVIEIGSPADHETFADRTMPLPTDRLARARVFGGQRFVRHQAADATWAPWRIDGFESRDLGIAAATNDVAGAKVVRIARAPKEVSLLHDGELLFMFVLAGAATLRGEDERATTAIGVGDAFAVPAGMRCVLRDPDPKVELLEVRLPGK
jgi:quercetin dioxygenase-like cupin family protein